LAPASVDYDHKTSIKKEVVKMLDETDVSRVFEEWIKKQYSTTSVVRQVLPACGCADIWLVDAAMGCVCHQKNGCASVFLVYECEPGSYVSVVCLSLLDAHFPANSCFRVIEAAVSSGFMEVSINAPAEIVQNDSLVAEVLLREGGYILCIPLNRLWLSHYYREWMNSGL
jgi:hypothetical protein